MRKFNDAKCVAIVNGHRCGLTPGRHGVENRSKLHPNPMGHSFVLAQNPTVAESIQDRMKANAQAANGQD